MQTDQDLGQMVRGALELEQDIRLPYRIEAIVLAGAQSDELAGTIEVVLRMRLRTDLNAPR